MTNIIPEMPDEYLRVYNAIKNAEGSITKENILLQIGQDESYTRKFHEIVYSLAVDYKIPIGSSSKAEIKGYFLIRTEKQLNEALKSLRSRVDKIKARENSILKSFGKQGDTFDTDDFKKLEESLNGDEFKKLEEDLNSDEFKEIEASLKFTHDERTMNDE